MRLILLVWFACLANALHPDQVDQYDWHTPLVGPVKQLLVDNSAKSSRLFVSTEKNVLASLNPNDGSLIWRHLLEKPISDIHVSIQNVFSTSGNELKAWRSRSGFFRAGADFNESIKVAGADTEGWIVFSSHALLKYSNNGKIWEFQSKTSILDAVVAGNSVYLVSKKDEHTLSWVNLESKSGHILFKSEFKKEEFALRLYEENPWIVLSKSLIPLFGSKRDKIIPIKSLLKKETVLKLWFPYVEVSDGSTKKIGLIDSEATKIEWLFESTDSLVWTSDFGILQVKEQSATLSLNSKQVQVELKYSPEEFGKIKDAAFTDSVIILTFEDGTISGFDFKGNLMWSRPEYLADLTENGALILDLPQETLTLESDELNEPLEASNQRSVLDLYIKRVTTHADQLYEFGKKTFESWSNGRIVEFISERVFTGKKDEFGIRKLLLFASKKGTVAAKDSLTGELKWTKRFNSKIHSIHLTRSALVKFPPIVSIVFSNEILYINALDGSESTEFPRLAIDFEFKRVFSTKESDIESLIVMDDQFNGFSVPPLDHAIRYTISKTLNSITGYKLVIGEQISATRSWTFELPKGESIAAFAKNNDIQVASIGRPLGNRKVLYKYLNPNSVAFTTLKSGDGTTVVLYILDMITGSVIYRGQIQGAGAVSKNDSSGFEVFYCENWVLATYYNHGPDAAEPFDPPVSSKKKKKNAVVPSPNYKGWELLVVELFENAKPDHRDESLEFSSMNASLPHAISQSFAVPFAYKSIGVTKTLHGISTREILVALDNDQLVGISKWLLDPRRPQGNPTNEEREEGLIPYSPAILNDPKQVISYHKQVLGIEKIESAATLLESTSVVLAHGIDLFFCRRTPSKSFDVLSESFNYGALLFTIFSLFIGIKVKKKKIKEYWK